MRQQQFTAGIGMVWFLTAVCSGTFGWTAEFRSTLVGSSATRQVKHEPWIRSAAPSRLKGVPVETEYPAAGKWVAEPASECGVSLAGSCGYWGQMEYLLWWRKGQQMPALLTSGLDTTDIENAGVLGHEGTHVLFGDRAYGGDAQAGGRLTLGKWLDACQILGVGTRLYALGEGTAGFHATSDQFPILARPFENATTGLHDADLVAFPGRSVGSVSIRNTSWIGGGDVFFRRLLYTDACNRVDMIAGYQFSRINQDLAVSTTRTSIDPEGSILIGTVLELEDLFETQNEYHAGEIGLWAEYDRGPWTWNVVAKVGLGRMRQGVQIDGQTVVTVPGQSPVFTQQGLLALDTNTGSYSQAVFAVSPEVALTGSLQLTESLALTVGYSFIYWNRVAQPAAQIDTTLNTTQLVGELDGPARPAFAFEDAGYFVQGLSFGVSGVY